MSGNPVRWQDDILQMMFWMRGEHLADEVSADYLNRFLQLDAPQLEAAVCRLIDRQLVVATGTAYRLTDRGLEEARRRFLDEFSSYLGKETHSQCSDPECDCHTPGWDGTCPSA